MQEENPTLGALIPYSRSHNPEIFWRICKVLKDGSEPQMYSKKISQKEYEDALVNLPLKQAYVEEFSNRCCFVKIKEENGSGMMMYRNGWLVMIFATELSENPHLMYRRQ